MVLRMKIFHILGFTEKSDFEGGFTKNQYRRGDCLKRQAWTVYRFKGGGAWHKRGSGVFEGGSIPQCTIWSVMKFCIIAILLCLNKFHIWENSGF